MSVMGNSVRLTLRSPASARTQFSLASLRDAFDDARMAATAGKGPPAEVLARFGSSAAILKAELERAV